MCEGGAFGIYSVLLESRPVGTPKENAAVTLALARSLTVIWQAPHNVGPYCPPHTLPTLHQLSSSSHTSTHTLPMPQVRMPHDGQRVQIRVGMHTGPCVR